MEEIPFEDRFVPKAEVDWDRSLWWWHPLTRAVHPAMRVTALATSAIAVLVIQLGLAIGNWLFGPRFVEGFESWNVRVFGSVPLAPIEVGQSQLFTALGLREIGYLTFCLLWLTAVLGFFGGILSRRAAVELGQRTIAPWGETLRIVGSRMFSYLWVTGMHLVAIAALLFVPFLLGLIARLGPLAIVAGVLLIVLFPLVLGVGRLVLSMFVCYPLAVTAISCERNADAFEGFSRSNNYFFQRPVVTVLCAIALLGVGLVGYLIVFWLLLAGWHWVRDAFLSGAGYTVLELIEGPATVVVAPVTPDSLSGAAGAASSGLSGAAVAPATGEISLQATRVLQWVLVGGWLTRLLIASYWFSYMWSATAAVYLILRRSVDNTDLDEIDFALAGEEVSLPELPAAPAKNPESL
jgi:hypothetical protein